MVRSFYDEIDDRVNWKYYEGFSPERQREYRQTGLGLSGISVDDMNEDLYDDGDDIDWDWLF